MEPHVAPRGLELTDSEGQVFQLEDCWRERPLVLVFLRHFG